MKLRIVEHHGCRGRFHSQQENGGNRGIDEPFAPRALFPNGPEAKNPETAEACKRGPVDMMIREIEEQERHSCMKQGKTGNENNVV
jgi:hypothetical protein